MDIWQATQSLGFPIVIAILFFIENRRQGIAMGKRMEGQHKEHREDRNNDSKQFKESLDEVVRAFKSNNETRDKNIDGLKIMAQKDLTTIRVGVQNIECIVTKIDNKCELIENNERKNNNNKERVKEVA